MNIPEDVNWHISIDLTEMGSRCLGINGLHSPTLITCQFY